MATVKKKPVKKSFDLSKYHLLLYKTRFFGFVLDGVRDEHGEKIGETIDEYGSVWNPVVSSNREYLEDW